MEQKRQAVIERMAAREREAEERKAARAEGDAAAFSEQVRSFEDKFADDLSKATAAMAAAERAEVIEIDLLEEVAIQIQELHSLVSTSACFLPVAVRGASSSKIGELEAALKVQRARLAPKKKFSFRDRSKLGTAGTYSAPAAEGDVLQSAAAGQHSDNFKAPAGTLGFRAKRGAILTRPIGESVHGGYVLEELERCDVRILTACTALWIRNLKDCSVFSVPCPGSIYLTACDNCTLVIGARQIRMHTSTNCNMYLHAASHPIIEHCSDLRIAPYPTLPQALASTWASSGMSAATNQVCSFWMKFTVSPRSSVLPFPAYSRHRGTTSTCDSADIVSQCAIMAAPMSRNAYSVHSGN